MFHSRFVRDGGGVWSRRGARRTPGQERGIEGQRRHGWQRSGRERAERVSQLQLQPGARTGTGPARGQRNAGQSGAAGPSCSDSARAALFVSAADGGPARITAPGNRRGRATCASTRRCWATSARLKNNSSVFSMPRVAPASPNQGEPALPVASLFWPPPRARPLLAPAPACGRLLSRPPQPPRLRGHSARVCCAADRKCAALS